MFAPLTWALTSDDGRITEASGSSLKNMYAEPVESGYGRVRTTLQMVPGCQERFLVTAPVGTVGLADEINGLISINTSRYGERLYGIYGGKNFFAITAQPSTDFDTVSPTQNVIASFVGTTQEDEKIDKVARMATDGRNILVIFGGNNVKRFDVETNVLRGIEAPTTENQSATLPDEEFVDILWTDGYFILLTRNGQIFHSGLRSIQFSQLDFGQADQDPDEIVGAAVFNRRVAVFGTRTIQYFANTGAKDFAYRADLTLLPTVGCLARDTIQTNDFAIYFLGSNGIVYITVGGNPTRISSFPVEYDIARSDGKKARAFVYTEEGHRFYSLTLSIPGEPLKNWTFDSTSGLWHNRTDTMISSAVPYKGQNMVSSLDGGKVGHLTLNTTKGCDNNILSREAIAPILFLNQMAVRVKSLVVDIDVSTHLSDADRLAYDNDVLSFDWSLDGKETWCPINPISERIVKNDGGFKKRVKFNSLGQFTSAHLRLSFQTGYRVTIIGVYADTEPRRESGAKR